MCRNLWTQDRRLVPKSLTLTTGSDIKLHLWGAAGFKCIQMSAETLQVLHVVDLLESTEVQISFITPFWVKMSFRLRSFARDPFPLLFMAAGCFYALELFFHLWKHWEIQNQANNFSCIFFHVWKISPEMFSSEGGCGSGVEPASCYQKVTGSTPLVCMLKCPWARYWTPNCSWCAGRYLAWQPPPCECMNYCKSLWTKASNKCTFK